MLKKSNRKWITSFVMVLCSLAPALYNGSACFSAWGEPEVPECVRR